MNRYRLHANQVSCLYATAVARRSTVRECVCAPVQCWISAVLCIVNPSKLEYMLLKVEPQKARTTAPECLRCQKFEHNQDSDRPFLKRVKCGQPHMTNLFQKQQGLGLTMDTLIRQLQAISPHSLTKSSDSDQPNSPEKQPNPLPLSPTRRNESH